MSAERGIVEKVEPGWAWVKTKRSGACSSCGSRHHCLSQGGDQMLVKAQNTARAKKGDEVELYLSTGTKLKGTAIVYLLPVLGIFVGAFSANPLSEALGLNPSLGMAFFTLTGLVAAVFLMRHLANRMGSKQALNPIVKRVVFSARSAPVKRI
ncbi:MAG: SoxR reducing system RseC family protein [Deltaproteobacteria bacterium]|jgi:sigma-E factor negative regulatory protein RseC|nr:SoxR reducing system RseC family protein [Deltaproteobacteria bacterium]MBW2468781.1 SoxR reducing system RseC family protein [Deltaproteobacteria bacterium]MBW2486247.1 SoxR reducing system RseC family protein [Deltaproteobacteria bacterium]MBW2517811.1 SoxR reducing system RseC family protein [Deltaproteobacteria bacterium]